MISAVERDVTVCHVTSGHAHAYGITSRQAIAEHVVSDDVTSEIMESHQKRSLCLRHRTKNTPGGYEQKVRMSYPQLRSTHFLKFGTDFVDIVSSHG